MTIGRKTIHYCVVGRIVVMGTAVIYAVVRLFVRSVAVSGRFDICCQCCRICEHFRILDILNRESVGPPRTRVL